jgi:branched-chain amino acid transport system permease protein
VIGKAVFGALLIAVILFLPNGVLGASRWRRDRARPVGAGAAAPRPSESVPAAGAVPLAAGQAAEPTPPSRESTRREFTRAGEARRAADLLVARGVRKSFSGVHALESVDIAIREGEILGLLGPNGSGKSTFINVVSGHYAIDAGTIRFAGNDITNLVAHRTAKLGIARTYQIPRPFAHLSVLDNVALTAMFGSAALERSAAEREAMRWLEFTGLRDKAGVLPDDLNLHQRKFLELARALASRPRLLLLDEVLSGLTPGEINEAVALIRRIRDDGATIVLVEHVMRAVVALTDRIVVLDHGLVIAEGTASDVMQQGEVVAAFLGKPNA